MLNTSRSTVNRQRRPEGWLHRLRRFVDGDDADIVVTSQETTAPRLRARDRFYRQLAQQINELLNQEAFGPPNVPLTLPTEIVINMAPDINAIWLNQARRRLVDGLEALIKERVKEMTNSAVNRTLPPHITLREDPTLDHGGVRLEARWGEPAKETSEYQDPEATRAYVEPSEELETTFVIEQENPLYHLDVFQSGQYQRRIPITKQKATIGRPSRKNLVDVELMDGSVSRVHAVLELEPTGIWLTALGRNQTRLGGHLLARRHRRQVRRGDSIELCGFMLRIADESETP